MGGKAGITPVVAMVLLLMMTVAAAGAAFAWFSGMLSGQRQQTSEQLHTRLAVKDASCGGGHVRLVIRNRGAVAIDASDVDASLYRAGDLVTTVSKDMSDNGFTEPDGVGYTDINFNTTMRPESSYRIELAFAGSETTAVARCTAVHARNCESVLQAGLEANGTYWLDPDGSGGTPAFPTYCDMGTAGGGWTLVATVADDGNSYWTYNNREVLWNGGTYGSAFAAHTSDFQSRAWSTVNADELMVRHAGTPSKYIVYSGILEDQTIQSNYSGGETVVGTFSPSESSGSWWYQCGGLGMRLQTPDSDGHQWQHGAWGFIWKAKRNHPCPWDDNWGALSPRGYDNNAEWAWGGSGRFYEENFGGSAAMIFVR